MKKALTILLTLTMLLSVAAFGTGTACAASSVDMQSILGTKENNEYVSVLLGIEADFDEDWYVLSEEETATEEAMDAAVEPLPLVPAMWANFSFFSGLPKAFNSSRVRERPSLVPFQFAL